MYAQLLQIPVFCISCWYQLLITNLLTPWPRHSLKLRPHVQKVIQHQNPSNCEIHAKTSRKRGQAGALQQQQATWTFTTDKVRFPWKIQTSCIWISDFALVYYHVEMDVTLSAEGITPVIRSAQAFFLCVVLLLLFNCCIPAACIACTRAVSQNVNFSSHDNSAAWFQHSWQLFAMFCLQYITSQTYLFTWLTSLCPIT